MQVTSENSIEHIFNIHKFNYHSDFSTHLTVQFCNKNLLHMHHFMLIYKNEQNKSQTTCLAYKKWHNHHVSVHLS